MEIEKSEQNKIEEKQKENWELINQGAEARIYRTIFYGKQTIIKERFSKKYRHPKLDKILTQKRVSQEVKCICKCRKAGILAPSIYYVDKETNSIFMEDFKDSITLKQFIFNINIESQKDLLNLSQTLREYGKIIANVHNLNIIHGDLTTSNILLKMEKNSLILIDFGLSYISTSFEDKGVDLYVLERAFLSTHPKSESLFQEVLDSYKKIVNSSKQIIQQFEKVRKRGRKRISFG
ncbi:o-sialoglycoprotein endopeptidase [Anaeramoeba ignava]|uniref:non-specific serine/threonine protein kinase n=1 Tax=Anaeramoeba ignava TaxID=1746090 RepID=A0A9Q0LRH5_ANAIG|nr:o-sialoglycoprotein endopeptidase [Anaeramoeba ignava]